MKCTVVHGDHLEAIEQFISQAESVLRSKNLEVVRLDISDQGLEFFEQTLLQSGLFGDSTSIIVFGLHKLRKKDELTRFSSALEQSSADVLVVHRGVFGKTALNAVKAGRPKAKFVSKKLPKAVFQWTERFGMGSYADQKETLNRALQQESAEFVFAMLIRQTRFLVEDMIQGRSSAPPFSQRSVATQANKIGKEGVARLYQVLSSLDLQQKSSAMKLPMSASLSILHHTATTLAKNQKKG